MKRPAKLLVLLAICMFALAGRAAARRAAAEQGGHTKPEKVQTGEQAAWLSAGLAALAGAVLLRLRSSLRATTGRR